MEQEKQEENLSKKIIEQVDEKINIIIQEGINLENLDALGKLVDIHKDLTDEQYIKKKEEGYKMRYNDYDDDYSERGRDRYSNDMYNNYSRRGVPGSGRGRGRGRYNEGNYSGPKESMQEIHEYLEEYMEGKEQYNRGNYGAKSDTMESLACMMEGIKEFIETLKEEAGSPDEVKLIQKYSRKISEI